MFEHGHQIAVKEGRGGRRAPLEENSPKIIRSVKWMSTAFRIERIESLARRAQGQDCTVRFQEFCLPLATWARRQYRTILYLCFCLSLH
jgi:hypothetical protein